MYLPVAHPLSPSPRYRDSWKMPWSMTWCLPCVAGSVAGWLDVHVVCTLINPLPGKQALGCAVLHLCRLFQLKPSNDVHAQRVSTWHDHQPPSLWRCAVVGYWVWHRRACRHQLQCAGIRGDPWRQQPPMGCHPESGVSGYYRIQLSGRRTDTTCEYVATPKQLR